MSQNVCMLGDVLVCVDAGRCVGAHHFTHINTHKGELGSARTAVPRGNRARNMISLCVCVCVCVCLSLSVCVYVSVCLSVCLSLSVYVSVCLSLSLSVYRSIYLDVRERRNTNHTCTRHAHDGSHLRCSSSCVLVLVYVCVYVYLCVCVCCRAQERRHSTLSSKGNWTGFRLPSR